MLLKCCTQYVRKFGKFICGHRTGKNQYSFRFPRRTVLKNVQITGQMHSSSMLVRLCSKSYNAFSRFIIAFFPRSNHLIMSWLQSQFTVILEPMKRKSVTAATSSPSICHEGMGPDAMILVFQMLNFKPAFSFSSFTLIKRLFSSSSLSAIGVVLSVYLRLIFLLAILIPACDSSSPTFCMMYSGYKLNKQGDNIQL